MYPVRNAHFEEMIGHTFNRLTVLSVYLKDHNTYAICNCACGTTNYHAVASNIRRGKSKSCGCLTGQHNLIHGHGRKNNRTPTYRSWLSMIERCNNPNAPNFHNYGGRGITVCDRWSKFENFLADMGERPEGKTIDRINNNGNYEPGNCKWSTDIEQHNNTRRSKHAEA